MSAAPPDVWLGKQPRGEAGRSRRPLNTGCKYEYALASGAIVFFTDGLFGKLGGDIGSDFEQAIAGLGLKLECTATVPLDYHREQDAQGRASGEVNRHFFVTDTARQYAMPVPYVEVLQDRNYLYFDEIEPRSALAGRAGISFVERTLPAIVRNPYGDGDAPFGALTRLLRYLPGAVYEANLVEFMFEFREACGDRTIRRRWRDASR